MAARENAQHELRSSWQQSNGGTVEQATSASTSSVPSKMFDLPVPFLPTAHEREQGSERNTKARGAVNPTKKHCELASCASFNSTTSLTNDIVTRLELRHLRPALVGLETLDDDLLDVHRCKRCRTDRKTRKGARKRSPCCRKSIAAARGKFYSRVSSVCIV